jgi:hypothetical protein
MATRASAVKVGRQSLCALRFGTVGDSRLKGPQGHTVDVEESASGQYVLFPNSLLECVIHNAAFEHDLQTRAQHQASKAKYNKSAAGKASQARYGDSTQGMASRATYDASAAGKASCANYDAPTARASSRADYDTSTTRASGQVNYDASTAWASSRAN